MSSHSDTILRDTVETLRSMDNFQEVADSLHALLDENQRLEHERDFLQRELGFKNTQRQEIKRLREALERISHLDPDLWKNSYPGQIAREGLAGDAE